LTGESIPSKKIIQQFSEDTPLADRENMVYLGTVVAKGKATAVVTAIGQKTELGHVATMVKETDDNATPLQKQINSFGKILGLILIAINILIFVVRGLKISILKINPFSNKFLLLSIGLGLIMLLIAIYTPFFNKVLHTVPLGIKEWFVLGCYAILSIVVYESGKKLFIAKNSQNRLKSNNAFNHNAGF